MMKTTITTILAILLLFITPSLAVADDGDIPDLPEGTSLAEEQEFVTEFSVELPSTSAAPTNDPQAPSISEEGIVQCSTIVGRFLRPVSYDPTAKQYEKWGKKIKKQLFKQYNVDGRAVKGYFYQYTTNRTPVVNESTTVWFSAVQPMLQNRKAALEGAKTQYTQNVLDCLNGNTDTRASNAVASVNTQANTARNNAVNTRNGALASNLTTYTNAKNNATSVRDGAQRSLTEAETANTKVLSDNANALAVVKKNYEAGIKRAKTNRANTIVIAKTFPKGSKIRRSTIRKAKKVYNRTVKRVRASYQKKQKEFQAKNKATAAASAATVAKAQEDLAKANAELQKVEDANKEAITTINTTYANRIVQIDNAVVAETNRITKAAEAQKKDVNPGEANTQATEQYAGAIADLANDQAALASLKPLPVKALNVLTRNNARRESLEGRVQDLQIKVAQAKNGSNAKQELVKKLKKAKKQLKRYREIKPSSLLSDTPIVATGVEEISRTMTDSPQTDPRPVPCWPVPVLNKGSKAADDFAKTSTKPWCKAPKPYDPPKPKSDKKDDKGKDKGKGKDKDKGKGKGKGNQNTGGVDPSTLNSDSGEEEVIDPYSDLYDDPYGDYPEE